MQLGQLKPAAGSKEKAWRKGRGHGSGNGKLAGRGRDGQKSRSGGGTRPLFEGGQLPLFRRLPKRWSLMKQLSATPLNTGSAAALCALTMRASRF